jgi:hypothetical protein
MRSVAAFVVAAILVTSGLVCSVELAAALDAPGVTAPLVGEVSDQLLAHQSRLDSPFAAPQRSESGTALPRPADHRPFELLFAVLGIGAIGAAASFVGFSIASRR